MKHWILRLSSFFLFVCPVFAGNPTTAVLDNFNRANGTLQNNGSWGTNFLVARDLRIVSNMAANDNSGGNNCDQAYTTLFGAGTQEAYCTYTTTSTSISRGIWFHIKCSSYAATPPATLTGYTMEQQGDGELRIYRIDNGVLTQLGATITGANPTLNDVVFFEGQNDASGTLTYYINGTSAGSRTDATYKANGGYIGFGQNSDDARMDNFGGGTASSVSTSSNLLLLWVGQ